MRILVMLNPTNQRGTKMNYTAFRKFLISDGYQRIGTELFMRVSNNRKSMEKHLKRMEEYNPGTGTIRIIKMTEKQYENIRYLTGEPDAQEIIVGANCHISL
ncbi:MAG: CRISPR-associated endonuclease Cas2 [Clostridiales bacterium]|jgi:CRISPR-associated protein Cas2|nr:CRISPR-associated endonuclease Cas2 [Clostridiales bacterium]